MKKPIFLLSFIRQYWPLLLVFVALTTVSHYDVVTYFVGPIFYLLNLVVAAIVGALLTKHVCFRRSLDAYTQKKDADGMTYQFVREFWAMEPAARVKLTVYTILALFLGAAWIAASIAK